MTIFYADDDREEIEFFCHAVRSIDNTINCITAENGQEAIRLLEGMDPPDFIFLDYNMPRMNGKECLTSLKKNISLKEVPVIIYSNTADQKVINELYTLGAFKFLTKKCNITEIRNELRSILKPSNCICH